MTVTQRDKLIREAAERYGRSVEEERALAEEAWIHSVVLAGLLDPEVQEHLGARLSAFRETALQNLRALYARAFPDREFPEDLTFH